MASHTAIATKVAAPSARTAFDWDSM
jgi:hypothetical protein